MLIRDVVNVAREKAAHLPGHGYLVWDDSMCDSILLEVKVYSGVS